MDDFSRAELARYAPMEPKKQYPMLTPSRTAFGNMAQTEFSAITKASAQSYSRPGSVTTVEDMINSARETYWDSNPQIVSRQRPWNSTHAGYQVAWQTHTNCTPTNTHSLLSMPCSHDPLLPSTTDDRLNWDLEPHPPWVSRAPTPRHTFERNLESPRSPRRSSVRMSPAPQPFRAPGWDSRHVVANSLSRDPIINGSRRGLTNRRGTTIGNLSPSRSHEYK